MARSAAEPRGHPGCTALVRATLAPLKELTLHRYLRLSSIVVSSFALAGALGGCGSSQEDEAPVAVAAPPNEAVVFAASGDTKAELGITKWGFATDDAGDLMTYRGYNDKNEVLATVVQKLDRSDETKYRFSLTMTGAKESASEKIEFTAHPTEDGKGGVLETLVTENSFEEGGIPSRVLARFKADGAARSGTIGSGSLSGKSRPLDGNALVTTCNPTANACQNELIDSRIAAAGASGDCGLLKTVGQPLLATIVGAGFGALASWWSGPGIVAGAVIGGAAGGVGAGAAAATQCIASRRDAAAAAADLKKCRDSAAASCAH